VAFWSAFCRVAFSGINDQTPAQAHGLEDKRWSMADPVKLAEDDWQPIYAAQQADKADEHCRAEDAMFLAALAN